jgi:hypothetical protein
MELRREGPLFCNGFGQAAQMEEIYLFPELKGSDLATANRFEPRYWMIVPQRAVGDDTLPIRQIAPRTYSYLETYGSILDSRGSSIYRGRPRFSVFGVGGYSFAPWKVAIAGLYKSLEFRVVGPYDGKPVVFDDTVNFLACGSEDEARTLHAMLTTDVAKGFYESLVFWDAKRPVTVEILRRLDMGALARELGRDLPPGALPSMRSNRRERGVEGHQPMLPV